VKWDFADDPRSSGWTTGAPNGRRPGGSWRREGRHIVVRDGWWASPPFEVESFGYYRVTFRSRGEHPGFCFVEFIGEDGKTLTADCCDGIEPSEDWAARELVFRAHASARLATVRFQDRGGELQVDEVGVERVGVREAAAWLQRLSEGMPPLECRFDEARWARLAETRRRLRSGLALRVVLLGDSIVNDTGNSLFEVLVRKAAPQARLSVVNSVRSSTGCRFYKDANRVREYVLRYEPDLVIIGGISNDGDAESVRSVVRQVREALAPEPRGGPGAAGTRPEFILMTGAVAPCESAQEQAWARALARVAEEEGAAFLDMRAAWDRQVEIMSRSTGLPAGDAAARLRRDPIHANSRGKVVLGGILAAYLSPPPIGP